MTPLAVALIMVAGIASLSWLLGPFRLFRGRTIKPSITRFFGSQIGGTTVINYSYTDLPWKLLAWDFYYFFYFAWALPYIIFPHTPTDSGDLDELALTRGNLFCVLIHSILGVLQLGFIFSLPLAILLPVWTVVLALGLFFAVNHVLCMFLNGKDIVFHSDEKYAPALAEHEHEQWIFLNGVAVGEHWLQNNLNRLALTFKRPILGIHNRTSGIVFDVFECLIQRNFSYATSDVRACYGIIKERLYDPRYSKVVFILHSQGCIEGGLVLDWLLQELPQDLLAKLEIYTFGNAANHFNNPHRHFESQDTAFKRPQHAALDATHAPPRNFAAANPLSNGNVASLASIFNGPNHRPPTPTSPPLVTDSLLTSPVAAETTSPSPTTLSDRAIGHIEHYAHTTDFVALWGVLHFAGSLTSSRTMPRFIGRLFARTCDRGGHQLNQHYLDGMFPLARDPATGEFTGCLEDGNEFMESEVMLGKDGDELDATREAFECSYMGEITAEERRRQADVEVHMGECPVATRRPGPPAKMKVKDLSRLWQYRNGKSPPAKNIARNATL